MKVCPSCEIKLTPAELEAGHCDVCGASLAGMAPTGPTDGHHDDGPHLPAHEILGWGTVRSGLLAMILGGVFQLLAGVIVGFLAWRVGPESTSIPEGMVNGLAFMAAVVLAAWGWGGQLMGFLFCMGVPSRTGARKWSVGAFLFGMLYLGVWLAFAAAMSGAESSSTSGIQERLNGQMTFLSLAGSLAVLALLSLISWVLFLARAGRQVGKPGVAVGSVVFMLAVLGFWLAIGTLSGLNARGTIDLSPKLSAILLASGGVVLIVWHLILLGVLRTGVTRLLSK